jgi:hypothetical protein
VYVAVVAAPCVDNTLVRFVLEQVTDSFSSSLVRFGRLCL